MACCVCSGGHVRSSSSSSGTHITMYLRYTWFFKICRKLDVTVIILWFPLPIAECYPCLFISNNPVVLCSNALHVGIRYKWSCVGCRSVLSREPGSAARTCCVQSLWCQAQNGGGGSYSPSPPFTPINHSAVYWIQIARAHIDPLIYPQVNAVPVLINIHKNTDAYLQISKGALKQKI